MNTKGLKRALAELSGELSDFLFQSGHELTADEMIAVKRLAKEVTDYWRYLPQDTATRSVDLEHIATHEGN